MFSNRSIVYSPGDYTPGKREYVFINLLQRLSVKFHPKILSREYSGSSVNDTVQKFKKGNSPKPSLLVYLTQIDFSPREVFQNFLPQPDYDIE